MWLWLCAAYDYKIWAAPSLQCQTNSLLLFPRKWAVYLDIDICSESITFTTYTSFGHLLFI